MGGTSSEDILYKILSLEKSAKWRKSSLSMYDLLGSSQFRVLILQPGKDFEQVQCRLVTLDFNDSPEYEALSYAWGDPAQTHSILCNGRKVGIPENLHAALWHLRHSDKPRIVWVDALCIDQQDLDERGHQVKLMKEIYSRASKVTVWIGKETEDLYESFKLLERLAAWESYKPEFILKVRSRWTRVGLDFSQATANNQYTLICWQPLIKLLEETWFRRVWVIQEVANASNVVVTCGRKTLDWRLLAVVIRDLQHNGIVAELFSEHARASAHSIIEMESTRRDLNHHSSRPLLSVLLATAYCECSDLRDKIFAVLSLANADGIEPDYRASVARVYQDFASWCVNKKGSIDFLSCVTPDSSEVLPELESLPSWVPDWTRIDNPHPFVRYSSRIPFEAAAWGSRDATSNYILGDVLVLQAQPVDIVDAVSTLHNITRPLYYSKNKSELYRSLCRARDWIAACEVLALRVGRTEDSASRHAPQAKTEDMSVTVDGPHISARPWYTSRTRLAFHESCPETRDSVADLEKLALRPRTMEEKAIQSQAFHRTMICGLTGQGDAASIAQQAQVKRYRDFLDVAIMRLESCSPEDKTEGIWESNYSKEISEVESSLYMWSSKRRFGITKSGKLAFFPKKARAGDIVFLVRGSKVPHLLRKRPDGTFTAIGEVYLDGAMQGEMSDEAKFAKIEVK